MISGTSTIPGNYDRKGCKRMEYGKPYDTIKSVGKYSEPERSVRNKKEKPITEDEKEKTSG